MLNRLLVGLLVSTMLAVGFNSSAAATNHSNASGNSKTTTDLIRCGLNRGANLEFKLDCLDSDRTSRPDTNTGHTSAPTTVGTGGVYAALGDSIAAGAGLPGHPNPTAQDTQCLRSSQAYPHIVAESRGLSLLHVACSGAKAGDLFTKQGVPGPNINPQLDVAFANGTPGLITITAGANDVRWADFLRLCYSGNCATATSTAAANAYLSALNLKLHYLFNDIKLRSNNAPPPVVITGYTNPISNYCIGRQDYATKEEIIWLNGGRDALNKTIRDVASAYPFVKYASTNFSEHSFCSEDSWIQGINDPAPFHPTARGQQHIAESVLKVL